MGKTTPIPPDKIEFIMQNKDRLRQIDIAREIKVSPQSVHHIIKGKRRSNDLKEDCFNIDKEAKEFYNF
jgi:predicted transcriptional regulator